MRYMTDLELIQEQAARGQLDTSRPVRVTEIKSEDFEREVLRTLKYLLERVTAIELFLRMPNTLNKRREAESPPKTIYPDNPLIENK